MNVLGVSDARQIALHHLGLPVPDTSPLDVEIHIAKLIRYKECRLLECYAA
jgi:hypothetical protein